MLFIRSQVKPTSYLDDIFNLLSIISSHLIQLSPTVLSMTSSHYELAFYSALIAENEQGVQIELFGNFSDPRTRRRLSNFSDDQALSNYYSNTQQLNISITASSP